VPFEDYAGVPDLEAGAAWGAAVNASDPTALEGCGPGAAHFAGLWRLTPQGLQTLRTHITKSVLASAVARATPLGIVIELGGLPADAGSPAARNHSGGDPKRARAVLAEARAVPTPAKPAEAQTKTQPPRSRGALASHLADALDRVRQLEAEVAALNIDLALYRHHLKGVA
jgi:hypothetical protein